jgi:signal transduction histidine kinase
MKQLRPSHSADAGGDRSDPAGAAAPGAVELATMAALAQRSRRSFGLALVGAFATLLVTFTGATVFSEARGQDVDQAAMKIATVCAPTISRLAAARSSLTQLRVAQGEYMAELASGRVPAPQMPHLATDGLATAATVFATLPPGWPGGELWQTARTRLRDLDRALADLRRAGTDDRRGLAAANQRFRLLAEQVAGDLTESIELAAAQARSLALRIEAASGHRRQLSLILLVLCVAATIVTAALLRRALRVHDHLLNLHNGLLESRSAELEAFAGRVAHDVRGSLTAVSLTMQRIARLRRDDAPVVELTDRGQRNLDSTLALVDGLLGFARAGAHPERNAACDIARVLGDVLNVHRSAAASAGVDLVAEPGTSGSVACSAGVLHSLLSNLIGNAIKHMGDGPVRRVVVRVAPRTLSVSLPRNDSVRIEVEDSGPGIPPGLRGSIFQPYVRASRSGTPGIGLGLATVKRLAEGHGGRVGIEPTPSGGSRFWFELPRPVATRTVANPAAVDSEEPRPATADLRLL